mmetsp:Transcript_30310/g.59358  ORF Transcript_30310/g.59358 Transcript_30310/m.59358 type:complete len:275 (+) Transcript_30310:220-1044(+)
MIENLPELVEASGKPAEFCDGRVLSRRECVDRKLELAPCRMFGAFYGISFPCNFCIPECCEQCDDALQGFRGRLYAVDDRVALNLRIVFLRLREGLEVKINKLWHPCSPQDSSTASRTVSASCKIHAVVFAIEAFLKFSVINTRFAPHEFFHQILLAKGLLHVPGVFLDLLNRDSLCIVASQHLVDEILKIFVKFALLFVCHPEVFEVSLKKFIKPPILFVWAHIRRVTSVHDKENDPARPNVASFRVFLPLDNLRCHVFFRTNDCMHLSILGA